MWLDMFHLQMFWKVFWARSFEKIRDFLINIRKFENNVYANFFLVQLDSGILLQFVAFFWRSKMNVKATIHIFPRCDLLSDLSLSPGVLFELCLSLNSVPGCVRITLYRVKKYVKGQWEKRPKEIMQNLWYGKKQVKSGKSSWITISFDVIRMWQIHYQGPAWATVIAVYLYAPWYLGSYSFTYFSIFL